MRMFSSLVSTTRRLGCMSSSNSISIIIPCIQQHITKRAISTTRSIYNNNQQVQCDYELDINKPVENILAIYANHGSVLDVLEQKTQSLKPPIELKENEIMIRFLASPINPADFNMIEGVYSIRPALPAIGGNEGVAVIVAMGRINNQQEDIKLGDWVIPSEPGFGTWRKYAICNINDIIKIPNDIPPEYAGSLSVNPCTAYRVLRDFHQLSYGDVIIQNGANSTVGLSVIQLAASMNIKTINIIRNRGNNINNDNNDDNNIIVKQLKELGADYVFFDDNIPSDIKSLNINKPILGLNAVGGRSSLRMASLLADNGTMVTYGGMSRKPVQVPTGSLIFNNISIRGFWLSRWIKENNNDIRVNMLNDIATMVRNGELKYPMELVSFEYSFDEAIMKARNGFRNKKEVFIF